MLQRLSLSFVFSPCTNQSHSPCNMFSFHLYKLQRGLFCTFTSPPSQLSLSAAIQRERRMTKPSPDVGLWPGYSALRHGSREAESSDAAQGHPVRRKKFCVHKKKGKKKRSRILVMNGLQGDKIRKKRMRIDLHRVAQPHFLFTLFSNFGPFSETLCLIIL